VAHHDVLRLVLAQVDDISAVVEGQPQPFVNEVDADDPAVLAV
jgi:hypothetical protein